MKASLVRLLGDAHLLLARSRHLAPHEQQRLVEQCMGLAARIGTMSVASVRSLMQDLGLAVVLSSRGVTAQIGSAKLLQRFGHAADDDQPLPLDIPIAPLFCGHEPRLRLEPSGGRTTGDPALIQIIASGFAAREQLLAMTEEELARTPTTRLSHLSRYARLSYLAPDIIRAIMDGPQPARRDCLRELRPKPFREAGAEHPPADAVSVLSQPVRRRLASPRESLTEIKMRAGGSRLATSVEGSLVTLEHRNRFAVRWIHGIMMLGVGMALTSTLLFQAGHLPAAVWMTILGAGIYLGYVPCTSILADRLIASLRSGGNAGYLANLFDAWAYFGSLGILVYRAVGLHWLSSLNFFLGLTYLCLAIGIAGILTSLVYFDAKGGPDADARSVG